MPYEFSSRVAGLQSSAIREILRVVNRPDIISFAGGLPAPELFPLERIAAAAQEVLGEPGGRQALQYSETEGHPVLRERIAERLPHPAGQWAADNVLITQGSQQGLDLLAKLFVDAGDEILVESPSYLGALQVFRFFGARITFLPCDEEGLLPEPLAAALLRRPKMLYVTPTFQNPSGLCYSAERRAVIRALLENSEVLLVEDDPYRELWYDEAPPAPLGAGRDPGHTVYLGSFSKTAAPGLRMGYLLAAPELRQRCVQVKQATDLQTNTLGQHLLLRLLSDESFDGHLNMLRKAYGARRDTMEIALREQLGDRLVWRRPLGGMFFWARLADGSDARELLPKALAEGLAFVPGGEFHADGSGLDTLRLNFTHTEESRLAEGVTRLAKAMAQPAGIS
jgi:2-aminoadipate transaminase